MTQYQDVTPQDSTDHIAQPRPPLWRGVIVLFTVAALIGLGTWLSFSVFKTGDSVTQQSSELTASQHTQHLVRMMRITAASDTTLTTIDSIPETVTGVEPLECGSRYADRLANAAVQLHSIDYLSTIAGARFTQDDTWRTQQEQSHESALALERLFPADCEPEVPVMFPVERDLRFADEISTREMLKMSDVLVEDWSELYLLAETAQQRAIARAGLWQITSWESRWSPGRSPFAFDF